MIIIGPYLFGIIGATELSTTFRITIALLGSEEPHLIEYSYYYYHSTQKKLTCIACTSYLILSLLIIIQFSQQQIMTLNPPVNHMGQPLALPQEMFILHRPNVEFNISIEGMGKKSAKGTGYLTNYRIIFVNEKPNPQFTSFDVPIANLYQQKVEFPLFGATYLGGSSTPYMNMLPGNCHFKLYFKNGGCDTFIKILSKLINQVRKTLNQHVVYEQSQFFNDMNMGKVNFNAYSDPNDPSVIYSPQQQKSF